MKYCYAYFRVEIPLDLGTTKERCEQAIREAEERARRYYLPADWTATAQAGELIIVRRKAPVC
jgi:hypothetical protein